MSHNSSAEDKQAIWGPSCPRTPFPAKLILSLDWPLRVTSILRPCQPHRGLPPTIRTPSSPQAGAGGPLGPTSLGSRLGLARHRHGLAPDSSSLPCRELHRWSFIPASSGGATSPLPSLPATLLWMTDGFPPCPGLRLVSGTLTFEGMAPSVEVLFPIPHLSHWLCNGPCLCRGTRLSWRPSFRPKGPLPPSLWGAGGGEGGGWLPSVPVASFPCFSGPVPPQLPVLFKAAPGTSASLSPRAAHHAEPRRPCRLLWVHTFPQPVTWTGEKPEHPAKNTLSDTFICGRHVPLAA